MEQISDIRSRESIQKSKSCSYSKMTFYINQCSLQYSINDPELEFFRKIIFSVIMFELFSVMVLRIMSGLKNYDMQMIRKGLEQKKRIQENAIFQTMENLNLNELSQHNQTVITLINSTKLSAVNSIKILKNDSVNISPIDTISLKKADKRKNKKKKEQHNPDNNSEQSNSSDQSEATQQNDEQPQQQSSESVDEYEMAIEQKKNFINVFNIKLHQSQASNFFNIILGHFFIAAALSLQQSPSLYSAIFSAFHGFMFVLLLVVNTCLNGNSNQVVNHKSEKENDGNRNKTEGIMMETKSQNKMELGNQNVGKPQERPIKKRISLLIMALMLLVNISLLSYSITQIKQSYFNPKTNHCQ